MKTNIITKISLGLLVPIIILGASLSEISVHADEVKVRHTAAQPESTRQPMAEQYGFPNTGGLPLQPRAHAALREIDLKVALKQYEKVAVQVEDIKLQTALGPEETGLSDQQITQWKDAQVRKQALLEVTAKQLRDKIEQLVAEANREAEAYAHRAAVQSGQSSPPSTGSNQEAPLKTPAVK